MENKIIGRSDVTGIGAASVIHQTTIQTALAITFQASGVSTFSGEKEMIKKKSRGPAISPKDLAPLNWGSFKVE